MKKLSLILTAAVLLFASFASAQNCNSLIVDKAGVVRNPSMIQNAASPLISQGADVHVVTIASVAQYGTNLEAVERFIESKCPSWTTNGVRKANLFVVMVAPNDRAKNIFLGSYYAGSFDIPSTYSNASNAYFKNRQFDAGLASVLNATGNTALAYHRSQFAQQQAQQRTVTPPVQQRTYTAPATTYPTQTQTADSGMSGFAIFMVVMFVMLALAIILYFVFRTSGDNTNTSSVGATADYSPSYSRRSYGAAAGPTHTTTVINNGGNSGGDFVTGMLVGEALNRPNYVPTPTYVAPSPVVYDPSPSYIPDPSPAPVADAPDSTWEDNTVQQSAPAADPVDTGWNDTSSQQSYEAPSDPPSFDPPSSDSGF